VVASPTAGHDTPATPPKPAAAAPAALATPGLPARPQWGAGIAVGDAPLLPLSQEEELEAARLCAGACRYFGEELRLDEVRTVVREALRVASIDYGVREAAEWADGFTLPRSMVDEDMAALAAHGGDFEALVRARQAELAPNRLSAARVARLHADNPERDHLFDLALGMRVPTAPDFRPNGLDDPPEELRAKYLASKGAVDKLLVATRADRLAFVFPFHVARLFPGAHFSPAGWAPKARKKSGRAVIDCSSTNNGTAPALNSDFTAKEAERLWDPIHHPTIADVARMVWEMVLRVMEEDGCTEDEAWARLVLWKTDLRAAYTLLNFRPELASLFMCRLVGGLAVVFLCGVFGWTATPHAFMCVTRALQFQLALVLLGLALIYVDDAMGVCRTAHLDRDMAAAKHEMRALLGDNACADDKDEHGRALDNIGFRVDLDARRVGISLKNLYSAFYAFFSLPIDGRVTKQAMERVASLASRYCLICRVMAPFSRPLYTSYTGRRSESATFTLNAEARLAVRLWRVVLCCAFLRHGAFSRDIKSFAPGFEGWILETDASLTGAGVIIYQRDAQGHEECMGAGAVSLEALGFGQDSSNQNTAEFIGAVVCMACALRMGRREQSVMLRGDSATALTWAAEQRFRGARVSSAAVVFTQLAAMGQLDVAGAHICAEDNWRTDTLSRRDKWESLGCSSVRGILDSWGGQYRRAPVIELDADPTIQELLALCRPAQQFDTEEQFEALWSRAANAARTLSAEAAARRLGGTAPSKGFSTLC
jgi:hypothetical protein